ncbi:hypothetical protein AX16_006910 [Volvariella volvacea WC 439]|nr:hypothetical protein AX16_006910 [Volvariella volvacea WC 439]
MILRLLNLITMLAILARTTFAQLQQITNFGPNPTGVQVFAYRPSGLPANPALVVAMHYCTGTGQGYYTGTKYASLANTYKFIVIYPDAPDPGGCWDVHTNATLTHDAGGDSLGIASAIRYAISNWGVDRNRVYATGSSSGAMMTQVMAGAYPDLIKAASAFSGVPYGCFAGPSLWNSQCAQGQLIKTAQQWGDQVRSGYPGYTGSRPKMQIWHGALDTTLNYKNFNEAIKQWTNVFGYSTTPASTQPNNPLVNWTRYTYGPNFQAISAADRGHDLGLQESDALTWFGIIGGSTPTTTTTQPPTTTNPSGSLQTPWGQCGGIGWTGPTACQPPYTCQYTNDWYSQVRNFA